MRVEIDFDRCTGHGRCYAVAPDLFDADDSGYGQVRVTGDLDPGQLEFAHMAVDNCPERAVMLVGESTEAPPGEASGPMA